MGGIYATIQFLPVNLWVKKSDIKIRLFFNYLYNTTCYSFDAKLERGHSTRKEKVCSLSFEKLRLTIARLYTLSSSK